MFAACSKDATKDLAIAKPIDKFHVTLADEDASRVQLDADCKTVWTEGDKVSIFNKTTANECWGFNGATGDTKGELTKVSGDAGEPIDKVFALYPYNAENTIANGVIGTVIPATQKYMKGSFGEGGNIMVATSDNTDLSFKHIFGWFKLQLTGDYTVVNSITFSGRNGELLAGKATVGDDLNISLDSTTAATSVTLDCGEGVRLSSTPTSFYIAVAPQTFANGIDIEVNTNGGMYVQSINHAVSIARNHIVPVKNLDKQTVSVITYTTSDGNAVSIYSDRFDAPILSHTYDNGIGVIAFDGKIASVCDYAFRYCRNLTSITIPDGVTSIGNYAFYGCEGLTSVTLPDGVTSIGGFAFYNCTGLTSVTIPNGVTSIGNSAFYYCTGLTSVTIPDGVTSIGNTAFRKCTALTSVTIPDSVTSIGNGAFNDCTGLTSVHITDLAAWCAIDFKTSGSNPLQYAHNLYLHGNSISDLVIPDSVTAVGNNAFSGYEGLTSVTIPDSVTSIGRSVFGNCKSLKGFYGKFASEDNRCLIIDGALEYFASAGLTEYTIPDGVRSIGNFVFSGCTGLTSITITDSVTSIGSYVFYGCTGLTSVTIPDSVTSIDNSAFRNCKRLKAFYGKFASADNRCLIVDGVLKSFAPAELTTYVIPDGVRSIGNSVFSGCTGLTSITIPDSVTSINNEAFSGCTNLKIAIIGNGVTSIGNSAFSGCKNLKDVTIPDSVTSIDTLAFYGCTGLTSITIPNGVTSIGDRAFDNCAGLTSIYCKPTTPPILGIIVFGYTSKIYVPRVSIDAYKSAKNWTKYASQIEGCDF